MTEIYTPKDWHSAFLGTPILAIDESTGKIYRGGDAYKLSKEAIGQIDYAQNCIYGADYAKLSRQPIAKLIYDGSTIKVYNWKDIGYDNKPMLVDQPLLYIVNGKIYDHDPRFHVVDDPRGHIGGSRSSGGSGSSSQNISAGAPGGVFLEVLAIAFAILGPGIALFIIPENLHIITMVSGIIAVSFALIAGLKEGFQFEGRILHGIVSAIVAFFAFGFIWFLFDAIRGAVGVGAENEVMEDIGLFLVPVAVFLFNCVDDTGETKKKRKARATVQNTMPQQPTQQKRSVTPPPKPTPSANPQPSKTITNPEQPKTPSDTKAPHSYYEHTYSHTCVKCGKTFYNTTAYPEVKLCGYCAAKIAVENEKKQQQNPNPNANKWFNTCQRCAKDFWSDKGFEEYCDSCKAVINESKKLDKKKAEEEAKKRKIEEEKNIKPPVKEKLEFGVFACPKCGANNRGPKGKILTCGNPNCKNKFKAEG